ncbi:ATP-binding cassette domain-containing protein [Streptomyces sp. Vc74B-19]|uniref:ATP-binding cassette domain-containing protein n=1 Tax=Streptomyces sp. Vc74B-19 TaxID=2741324 RepID=UPI001BFC345E|nr:ATP-binding cassette domain-containing protein [Streptomyces sp. Vc74B-19]MBT3166714.1 ATP-binding cassette domain-containing protein [Streptomyces sp. Vc74B-19]
MDDPSGLAVTADGLGLKGPRGWAFRDVSVDAEPGALIAVVGPSGTGRTCLLLALTGRMRPTEGQAAVGGLELPRRMAAVRRRSALAHVTGVTDLDPALTVAEHLHEQELLRRRFGSALPRPRQLLRPRGERRRERRRHIDSALARAGLDLAALPKHGRTAVRDLERVEALRLSLALALLGRPRLLGVDDTDLKLSSAEREEVWALLRSVAATGVTVLAVCSEPPADAVVVRTATARPAPADQAAEPAGTAVDGDAEAEEPAAPAAPAEPAEPTGAAESAGTDHPHHDHHPRHDHDRDHHHDHDAKEAAADALAETGRS